MIQGQRLNITEVGDRFRLESIVQDHSHIIATAEVFEKDSHYAVFV